MAWIPVQEQLSGVPITDNLGYATAYELSYDPIDATLAVFLNSGFQRQGTDYNISGTTLTWTDLIPTGDNVFVTYFYNNASSSTFNADCQDHQPTTPTGVRGSTTLNHSVTSYELLADRIKYQLGWPATRIEICDDQIYDFINQGCEWYSKYAGTTEEYLMFTSSAYQRGVGIKMDNIISSLNSFYSCTTDSNNAAVSARLFDCDLNNYRKVVDVFSVDPVENTGTDTLFTMDYLFAQQTYFSYLLGSFGFDLVTWHILKDWLNLREKMFATTPYIMFDPRSQYMRIIPEPVGQNGYIGVVGCHVERSIADLVQERWVQRYALALTKMALAHIRGKFGQVTLFGGATLNANDLMTQGLDEKAKLEDELMNQFGEVTPPMFFVY